MNSLAARPVTKPSVLNSRAGGGNRVGETGYRDKGARACELGEIVIHAQACEQRAEDTRLDARDRGARPRPDRPSCQRYISTWPTAHTAPPQTKARSTSPAVLDFGECRLQISAYCSFCKFTHNITGYSFCMYVLHYARGAESAHRAVQGNFWA